MQMSNQRKSRRNNKTNLSQEQASSIPLDNSWISATSTYNYMMKDPLLDWLKYHHNSFFHNNRKYRKLAPNVTGKTAAKLDRDYGFTPYIMKQGIEFERKVMKLITKKFGVERVAEINGDLDPRNPAKAVETLEAMKSGIPIIHSGVLHDPARKTFGITDLLVRSDWLKFLIRESPPHFSTLATIPAPKLDRPWHYVIIDIKFTGLLLRADATHLLNAASFPAYKSQLLIYNWALGYAQGYTPDEVYILGRRWKYSAKGEIFSNDTCFDKVGIINYIDADSKYVEETENALQWLREVRTEAAANWNITDYPLARWELYPNMCNKHDYPWHSVKEELAVRNKELTHLWMVGPKNRKLALQAGICQWTDKRCTATALGVNGIKTNRILSEILRINRSKTLKIAPDFIENNINNWKRSDRIEFFVDFETCNGVISNIKRLPLARTGTIIFMIGVGYIDPVTGEWMSREFIVDSLTLVEEERICRAFSTFIIEKSREHRVQLPRCIHWARAEDIMWADAIERHAPISHEWKSWLWTWVDLLEIFKAEPIVIKGCMSFGLKDVASAMKEHGFITTAWDKTSECIDGQSAMVAAQKASILARKARISMCNVPVMRQIQQYNQVDVRVLYEILTYLRNNHARKNTIVSRGRKRQRTCNDEGDEKKGRKRKRDDEDGREAKRLKTDDVILSAMNEPDNVSSAYRDKLRPRQ